MKIKSKHKILILMTVLLMSITVSAHALDMIDYTAYPPFLTTAVEPNILLVLDHSGSMQFPAYNGCYWSGYSSYRAQCGTSNSTSEPEYKYDSSKDYYGYFETDKYYRYSSNKYIENATCSYTNKIGGTNCISGNLLNWATMTRIDLMRKALIGGNSISFQSNNYTLQGEGGWRTYTDNTLKCKFTVSGGSYPDYDHKLTISNSNGTCAVGTVSNTNIRVDVPENNRRGIIQNLSDQDYDGIWDADAPRFGLMIYAGDNREGEMRVGIEGSSMSDLIVKLQDEPPYHGTPTGEALREAYDYYTQKNNYGYESNSSYIGGPGSIQDPMYISGKALECRDNFVLLISDGEYNDGLTDPVRPARENLINDIRSDIDDVQNIMTYSVFIFGSTGAGQNSMQQTAMYGGFDDYDSNKWPYDRTAYPADSRTATLPAAPCLAGSTTESCMEWDEDSNGLPDNYFEASDGNELEKKLIEAITKIMKRASSGTAVSVLATTGSGEGAVYQAYFYPEKLEGFEPRKWFGYMQALFVDKYGNLREDTDNNDILDMIDDLIIQMEYNPNNGTKIKKCKDKKGDGSDISCPSEATEDLEDIKTIWEGGEKLWTRDPATRTIFTTINGYDKLDLATTNSVTLMPYLRAADNSESTNMINWIRGYDFNNSHSGVDFKPYVTDAGHANGYRKRSITSNNQTRVWKLGDIVNSTPTVVGRPMENYDLLYGQSSYTSYRATHINRRNVVYTGANDGMLHAFNAGTYDAINHKFDPVTGDLGEELWAFIPRSLLPHMKWLTDPDYTHVYYVDSKPKITDINVFTADADHEKGWGTILIGSFRYGGKDISWSSGGSNYSASPEYFALDVTDPLNPRLLWTFSHPDLGLSMSYPAIARVGSDWYAIFGSGATNYNNGSNLTAFQDGNIFVLKISGGKNGVIDSWTDAGINRNFWKISTGKSTAFLADAISVDVDIDFDVDVIYIGENYQQGGSWNALMKRLTTNKGSQTDPIQWALSTIGDINSIAGNNDLAKKITAAPSAAMDDRANLWLFFGTGQFLGTADKNQTDTGGFYAIKDGCWNGSCGTSYSSFLDISKAEVKPDGTVTGISGACGGAVNSWSNLLNASYTCDGWTMYFKSLGESIDFTDEPLSHNGERVTTKPLVLGGLVTWATYIPGIDECSYVGESNVYAVYYKTGTAYKKYVFTEQKAAADIVAGGGSAGSISIDKVARVKKLGAGMPSSISAQVTSGGTVKGFAQQSTGSILGIESITPISLKSGLAGWKSERIP